MGGAGPVRWASRAWQAANGDEMNGTTIASRISSRLGWTAALALVAPLLWSAAPARADWPFSLGKPDPAATDGVTPVRVLKLSGVAREKLSPWDIFQGGKALLMPQLLMRIAEEARAPGVKTLIFKLGDLTLGASQAEELAAAMKAARQRGKRVVVHAQGATLATLLASAPADVIAMTPEGSVFAPGLQAEIAFYKDLLGTLGVEADIESVGQYKSAMEPFTRTSLSDAARENMESLVGSLWDTLVAGIATARKLPVDKVTAAIDKGLLQAEDAKAAGLIDQLAYWGDLLAAEETRAGTASKAWPIEDKGPEIGSIFDLFKLIAGDTAAPADTDPKVAVLVAEGPIVDGSDPSDLMNAETVIAVEDFLDALHAIEADPQVKALVVRIDSPGGSALASDLIWRELERVDKRLPVVASMGNVAASGGYYIASAARKIFADPTTMTGSIGVFGGKLVYGGLLDKVGVRTVVIARGKNAGMFSGLGRFSDGEREVMRKAMEHTYKTFVNRVAKGRNMSFDAVHKVAQGRVWTGRQALDVGLVDRLGGLSEAIAEAARLSKTWGKDAEPEIEIFPKAKSFFELLGKDGGDSQRLRFGGQLMALARGLPSPISGQAQSLARVVESLVAREPILAMMPFAIALR